MPKSILFLPDAWEQYLYWQETDLDIVEKINSLIKECQRTPFKGLGKPEPLKNEFKGFWSRRINSEHRLVYKVYENIIEVAQCRFHY